MKVFNFKLNMAVMAAATLVSTNLLAAETSSSALNIGGFVDAQARWKKVSPESSNTKVDGFVVGDGALYLSKEVGSTKFMLDLPFQYDDAATDGTFKFAKTKAQGYVAWNYRDGVFGFQLGQFDSPIGFESADSIDLFFPDAGMLGTTGFIPTTHTGLMLMSTAKTIYGSWSAKGIIANQAGNNKKGGENFETAAQLRFDHDLFYTALSYLYYKHATSDFKHQMIDLMVGTNIAHKIKVDAEATMGKDGQVYAAGTAPAGTNDQWGQAYQLNVTTDITDQVAVGVRGDYTHKMPALFKAAQISAGPIYKVSEAMSLKADYTFKSVEDVDGAAKVKTNALNLAGQFRF